MFLRLTIGLGLPLLGIAASGETPGAVDLSARNETFQTAPAPIAAEPLKKNDSLERPKLEVTARKAPVNSPAQAKLPATATPARDASQPVPAPAPIVAKERKLSPVNGRLAPLAAGAKKEQPATDNVYQQALDSARTVTVHQNITSGRRAGVEEINGFVITRQETEKKDAIPAVRAGSGETPPKP